MPSCLACGAELAASGASAGGGAGTAPPCAKCGAKAPGAGADLELDLPKRGVKGAPAAKPPEAEVKLELAIDPRSLHEAPDRAPISAVWSERGPAAATALAVRTPSGTGMAPAAGDVGDVAFDARLLADYGKAPKHWLLSPVYAWRVLRRQRELKKALEGRREEVKRALTEADDARVAFAERIRHDAEKPEDRYKPFVSVLEQLRAAEELLRSRDRILASEQDAQTARLASVDARLARLEAEVAHAQAAERAVAGELASAQAALARSEQKLKRAESELRSAQQRETDGSRS